MAWRFVKRVCVPLCTMVLATAFLPPATTPVHAICDPPAANNVNATCSGVTLNQGPTANTGYGSSVVDNATVNVLTGASVTGTNIGLAFQFDLSVINSGSITGQAAEGIIAESIISLTNLGSISAGSDGVRSFAALTNLTNSGSISAGGDGVQAGSITSLTNSGSIRAVGRGVLASELTSLTNSGLIQGGIFAIQETAAADTLLTLLPGSVIVGPIDLGGGVNTLNVGNGLSIANTFLSGGGTNAPVIGSTFGAPFAVSGNQVAVVDPTNLAAQGLGFVDLTGGVFSTVENRMSSLRNGAVLGVTTARPMAVGYRDGGDTADAARQYWLQGFGSFRDQGASAPAVGFENRLGGVVSGLDAARSHMTRVGFFLGGSWGEVEADFDSQKTEADSFFGGLYASTLKGRTAIDMALTVGFTGYDHERRVANNLAPGGLEQATASYDGVFVSPEITFTRPLWSGGHRFEKSLTLRYGGLFLDGFTETGTAAPISVADRDLHIMQARGQILLPYEVIGAGGTAKRAIVNFGVEGRGQFGDNDVTATLLGQNLVFNPGGDDAVAGLFGGLRLERETDAGSLLYAAIEGQADSDDSRRVSGKAGFRVRF